MNLSSLLIFQVYFSITKLAANCNYNSRIHLSLATASYTLYYRVMPQHYATIYKALKATKDDGTRIYSELIVRLLSMINEVSTLSRISISQVFEPVASGQCDMLRHGCQRLSD